VTPPKISNGDPISVLYYPIFDHFNRSNVVGILNYIIDWKSILSNVLPEYVNGLYCVLRVSNGESFTFYVNGGNATFPEGEPGDFHDTNFDRYEEVVNANFGSIAPINDNLITFSLYMYPSEEFESEYKKPEEIWSRTKKNRRTS